MLKLSRDKRKRRMMDKNRGTGDKPRLNIFRSNKYIYAQVINDEKGETLAHARGVDAKEVGKKVAEIAIKKKVSTVIFDRAGYRYHGRVKSLADAAREAGLLF